MDELTKLSDQPRTTVRRPGAPDPDGACVIYWMQRAQRGVDNPALDLAVEAANVLKKPSSCFWLLCRFIHTRIYGTTGF